ncbi:protein LIFEGUARD 2-like [Panicum virgatum]|uniref:protein LIFEGUARD 2-like n=1 Tax=Panicum virgatum TaxID=38727 RepID=UPI0019D5144C|nr:protein LIFEGUARD 2-like [Panicum virgatum]
MIKYREKHPVNLLLLCLVRFCFSLCIGILTSVFIPIGIAVLQSMILTEVAMINLIIYTFWAALRHYKVTFLLPFLINHLLIFVVYLTIQVNCPLGSANMTAVGCCVTMLFVLFIIHDMDLLIKRHKYKEHIFAAISLYPDLINLVVSFLLSPSK